MTSQELIEKIAATMFGKTAAELTPEDLEEILDALKRIETEGRK